MLTRFLKRQQGFTLLELLIVIVIIGILAVIIVPGLSSGPKRARDAQRKADMRGVKNALETFYNDNNSYPVQTTTASTTGLTATALINATTGIVTNYLPALPCDPRSSVKTTTTTSTLCTDTVDGSNTLRYLYKSAAAGAAYRVCATLENAQDGDDGNTTSNVSEGYSVTSINGTAPGTLCTT